MDLKTAISLPRHTFIGGSDARIIMGDDGAALLRLWREKRGEIEPEDLSGNLIVQLGVATEELNRRWFERNTGRIVTGVQRQVQHPVLRWMAATLDGIIEATGAVFEAKFMLPWAFAEEAAAEKHMAQLQHNMWVTNARLSALSIITGGGKWVEIEIAADPLYQHLLLTAEKKFWRCVESGEPPRLFGVEPPQPRIAAVRTVDMSASNSWAEFAATFRSTREAFLEHERAKTELKALVPEDAREAFGHSATRMKLVNDADKSRLVSAHRDEFIGKFLLADALGAVDLDFSDGLISQLANAGAQGQKVDVQALNFMLSVVKSIKPRDQVESMLAAQMAGIHMATMRMMQRLANADNIPRLDSTERALNKLARTFAAQVEALKRYRTGGEQTVTVQHVSVSDGGQAIVGNVTQASRETAAEQVAKTAPQLTHAKEAPMTILGAEANEPTAVAVHAGV